MENKEMENVSLFNKTSHIRAKSAWSTIANYNNPYLGMTRKSADLNMDMPLQMGENTMEYDLRALDFERTH